MTAVEDRPVANGHTPSTELVRRTTDVPKPLAEKQELARVLATSGLMPRDLQGKPQNVLVVMFAAQSLGIDLFPATQELYIVHGKVGMSALMMRNRVLELGHYIEPLDEECDTQKAVILILRRGRKEHRVTFTIQEAIQAGLCKVKDGKLWARGKSGEPTPWETNPADMLVARATARAVRRHVPEAILGAAYTPEELESGVYDDEPPKVTAEQVQPDQAQPATTGPGEDVVDGEVVEDAKITVEQVFAAVAVAVQNGDRKAWQEQWNRAKDADLADAFVGDKPVKVWLIEANKAMATDQFEWVNPLEQAATNSDAEPAPEQEPAPQPAADAAETRERPEGEGTERYAPPPQNPAQPVHAEGEAESLWGEAAKPGSGLPDRRGGDPT